MQCLRHLEVITRFFRNDKISITIVGPMMISVIECYCMSWLIVTKYLCHKGPGYIPFVVITIRSFPQS
jgi:hypothetical protein